MNMTGAVGSPACCLDCRLKITLWAARLKKQFWIEIKQALCACLNKGLARTMIKHTNKKKHMCCWSKVSPKDSLWAQTLENRLCLVSESLQKKATDTFDFRHNFNLHSNLWRNSSDWVKRKGFAMTDLNLMTGPVWQIWTQINGSWSSLLIVDMEKEVWILIVRLDREGVILPRLAIPHIHCITLDVEIAPAIIVLNNCYRLARDVVALPVLVCCICLLNWFVSEWSPPRTLSPSFTS